MSCSHCLRNTVACIISKTTGRRQSCNLYVVKKFRCDATSPTLRPPFSLPSCHRLSSKHTAATPRSDPTSHPGPSGHQPSSSRSDAAKSRLLPTVVIPPRSSTLICRHSPSRTSQELDELHDSPSPVKKCKVRSHPKLPPSSPILRLPSLKLPDTSQYFDVPRHTTWETVLPTVLRRPPNPMLI